MSNIKNVIREDLEKAMNNSVMNLNMWYTLARMSISIKARKLYKEGCSKEFIEKWRKHAERILATEYNDELKKIEESQK